MLGTLPIQPDRLIQVIIFPLYTLFLIHGHPFEQRLNRRLVSSSADRPLPQTRQIGSPFQTILFM